MSKIDDIKAQDTVVSKQTFDDDDDLVQVEASQPGIFCDSNIVSKGILSEKKFEEAPENLQLTQEQDSCFKARPFDPNKNHQKRVKLALKPFEVGE